MTGNRTVLPPLLFPLQQLSKLFSFSTPEDVADFVSEDTEDSLAPGERKFLDLEKLSPSSDELGSDDEEDLFLPEEEVSRDVKRERREEGEE